MKQTDLVKVTYYLTKETRMRLRILSAKTDKPITAIVDEAVKAYLDAHED
jgi:predicted DNA-binding protein